MNRHTKFMTTSWIKDPLAIQLFSAILASSKADSANLRMPSRSTNELSKNSAVNPKIQSMKSLLEVDCLPVCADLGQRPRVLLTFQPHPFNTSMSTMLCPMSNALAHPSEKVPLASSFRDIWKPFYPYAAFRSKEKASPEIFS